MIGEIVARAANLAATDEPSVNAALRVYQQLDRTEVTREAQIWVSVAFLCKRHTDIVARLQR